MASKSTSFDSSSTDVKLVWNIPLDSEETFEVKMAELKTTLIKESIYHCVSESNSNDRLAARPRSADAQSPSYAPRYAAWEKSMRELNDDANAAMGTLLALFHPDCNAHRELSSWFEENVTAALPQHDRGRMNYNFRNAWVISLISKSTWILFSRNGKF